MNPRQFVRRSVVHYWRTNLAVVAAIATAVSVMAGALVVGDSIRGSLRQLVLDRIGAADFAIQAPRFFREALADDIRSDPRFATGFSRIVPVIVAEGLVTAETTGRRAGRVLVYGVDERFWRFHGVEPPATGDRDALVSPALAAEAGLAAGDVALIRTARPTAIPLESVLDSENAVSRIVRVTVGRVLGRESLSEFSLRPYQGDVRAIFVPLRALQAELDVAGRVNTLLAATTATTPGTAAELALVLRDQAALADTGLALEPIESLHAFSVEADAGRLTPDQVASVDAALESTLIESTPILRQVVKEMRAGTRSLPHAAVAAVDLNALAPAIVRDSSAPRPSIVLSASAANDLGVRRGDVVALDYDVWEDGRPAARTAEFQVAGVVPARVIDHDDAPMALIPLAEGQRLWTSRHGALTSIRLAALPGRDLGETVRAFDERLRSKIDPAVMGITVAAVRAPALAASHGSVDFGEHFLYAGILLIAAALALASLVFRMGVDCRTREVALLTVVGLDRTMVRRMLAAEAVVLSAAGAAIGVAGAILWAALAIKGLTTWWIGAVGTTRLVVHVSMLSLVAGAAGGLLAAIACTWWTLRGFGPTTDRSVLAGDGPTSGEATGAARAGTPMLAAALVAAAIAAGFVGLGISHAVAPGRAFVGAGIALLLAGLCACAYVYRRPPVARVRGRGWRPIAVIGARGLQRRPGRNILSTAVVAVATFALIAADAFKKETVEAADRSSASGGYALIVESLLPIVHDPANAAGRDALGLGGVDGVDIDPFRLRPGDDASGLNLYRPQEPRILGATAQFIAAGRFAFDRSIAATDEDRANPWRLLERPFADAVPVIADIAWMNGALHRSLGDEIVIQSRGRPVRLRLVAALRDSVFQQQLVMSDTNFRALFPEREGYQVLLVDAPEGRVSGVRDAFERTLADSAADVVPVVTRLADFRRAWNTRLSMFQTLGGLGLVVGAMALAVILSRNVLERRKELALLGAVGYRARHLVLLLAVECLLPAIIGLVIGAASASLAMVPAVAARGGGIPMSANSASLMAIVTLAGVVSAALAARLATRGSFLAALKPE